MKIGQEVYTVNAKNNMVDRWHFYGSIRTEDGIRYALVRGRKHGFFPAKCVFESKEAALRVSSEK